MKRILLAITLFLAIFPACNDDVDTTTYEEQLAIDIQKIEDYLEQNNLTAQSLESGLHYIIDEQGTGNYPTVDSIVEINYTLSLLNDEMVDSGTLEQQLDLLILGMKQGLPLFREGGKGKIFLPSSLGYGIYNSGPVPANSVLRFDINLWDVSSNEDE